MEQRVRRDPSATTKMWPRVNDQRNSMSTLCQSELTTRWYAICHDRPDTCTSRGEIRGSTTMAVSSTGRRFSAQHLAPPVCYYLLRTHSRSWSHTCAVQLRGGYSTGRTPQSRIEYHTLSARSAQSSIEEKYQRGNILLCPVLHLRQHLAPINLPREENLNTMKLTGMTSSKPNFLYIRFE